MILTVVLYAVEILFLCIMEEQGSRMFEERVLSKMLRPKKKQVIGDEKMVLKLSNQEGKTGESFSMYGREEISHSVLVGRSKGRRSLGRPGRRWEDNINFKEIGWCVMG